MKKAERLQPQPIDRAILASLVYSTMKRFDGEAQRRIETTVAEEVEKKHHWLKGDLEHEKKCYAELEARVKEFEAASGVHFRYGHHDIPKIGAAVRRVMTEENVLNGYRAQLEHVVAHGERVVSAIRRELAELKGEAPTDPEADV
jgi:hypothetical protein